MDRYEKFDQQKLGKGLGEMHIESNKFNPKKFWLSH